MEMTLRFPSIFAFACEKIAQSAGEVVKLVKFSSRETGRL